MEPTPEEFLPWRNPRRGQHNPEVQTNYFWFWCIDQILDAHRANQRLKGPDSRSAGPCWSAIRYGQSENQLSDGTRVHIGGHSTHNGDPDYYLYNDVWTESPEGELCLLGYPESDFPPCAFHSCTQLGNHLLVVGGLGARSRHCPVLALDTQTWEIEGLHPTGGPGPICRHQAEFDPQQRQLLVSGGEIHDPSLGPYPNLNTWALQVGSWEWQRIESSSWQQFKLRREDGEALELSRLRFQSLPSEFSGPIPASLKEALQSHFGNASGDPQALAALYRFSFPHQREQAQVDMMGLPTLSEDSHRFFIHECPVLIQEGVDHLLIQIQGPLENALQQRLLEETRSQLAAIEGSPIQLIDLPA